MLIELKTIKPFFDDIWYKSKKFEIRINDRNYYVGQQIVLLEYNPILNHYSGRAIIIVIDYILHSFPPGLTQGYCIFSFSILKKEYNYKRY